ncbi:MAG: sulfate ABC transporter substrate-binding protein [Rudaea sp.]
MKWTAAGWVLGLALSFSAQAKELTLLNVSYDPTRELYQAINTAFAADWKAHSDDTVTIQQSHGGSSAQSRKIIDGLEADVATLGIASDIDALAAHGELLAADWQKRLPNDSTPYTSTIIFLVRKGNPKAIKDWDDLVKSGTVVITPNPKTSAGARWNFLAAYAHALKANDNDDAKARAWIAQLFKNVPVLDTGARGSTLTFAQRGLGDVLIAWENEAYLAITEFGDKFDIVNPSTSILAQPPVAVVDKNVTKHGTEKVADAYLKFLYTPQAQDIIAKNHYRPVDKTVAEKYASSFPKIEMTTIAQFGGWSAAQPKFFGDGGVFDQIYQPAK